MDLHMTTSIGSNFATYLLILAVPLMPPNAITLQLKHLHNVFNLN